MTRFILLTTVSALLAIGPLPAPARTAAPGPAATRATAESEPREGGARLADGRIASDTRRDPREARRDPDRAPGTAADGAVAYGQVPLYFEVNQGQTNERVRFLARGREYALFLTSNEAVLALRKPRAVPREPGLEPAASRALAGRPRPARTGEDHTAVVRMKLVGANPTPQLAGQQKLSSVSHYFRSSDPTKGLTSIPHYARVTYVDVYPGVDLVYYGSERQLEYDFVVAPGADPAAITLAFDGVDRLEVDARGDLVLQTPAGAIRQPRPLVYQEIDGIRQAIPGDYALKGPDRLGFRLGPYDAARPLVIDPVLVYSTYLGGSGDDVGMGIAVDAAGNAYVTGTTPSVGFPAPQNSDAFVAKFSPTGALLWFTSLGDRCDDEGRGITVDGAGNAYVTGRAGLCLVQDIPPGVLVAKLAPTGALLYLVTFGASLADTSWGQAVAVDGTGNAYVTGLTSPASRDFPTTDGAFRRIDCGIPPDASGSDAFVAKVNAAGTALVYSTYLCGSGHESANAIAVDAAGHAYVTGSTESKDFPTQNAFQPNHGGFGPVDTNGFVTKLNPSGSALVYSTYLGGRFNTVAQGIAVRNDNAYVSGWTESDNFPTTAGAVQPAPADDRDCGFRLCTDAFVTQFNAAGSALVYSTYLGGQLFDEGTGIAVDAAGHAYLTGWTASLNFPTVDAFQPTHAGVRDAFVSKLNPTGSALVYSSFLGGGVVNGSPSTEGSDFGIGIALDGGGNAYVTGITDSPNFPTTDGAHQPNFGGGCFLPIDACHDAFVAKIGATGGGGTTLAVTPTTAAPGATVTASWSGIPNPTATDWVALYAPGAADTALLSWRYTTGTASGSVPFLLPTTLAPGTYELRLFANDGFTRLATSNALTVTEGGGGGTTLTVSPTTAAPGATVTASWSGIANPTAADWLGLYAQEAADPAFLSWRYTTGTASGSVPFLLPTTLAPGTYELRLFANDGFTRLATSNALTVP